MLPYNDAVNTEWQYRNPTYLPGISFNSNKLLLLTAVYLLLRLTALAQSPAGVNTGLKLWLDASDINANNIADNPADNTDISTWYDKSGNGNNAVRSSVNSFIARPATFYSNQIAGNPVVRFNRVMTTTGTAFRVSGLDIRARINPDITIFTVYKQGSRGTERQAVWGNDNQNYDRFFFSHEDRSENGSVGVNDGAVSLGPALGTSGVANAGVINQVQLLTAVYDGNVTGSTNSGPSNGSAIYLNGRTIRSFTDSTNPDDALTSFAIGHDGDDNAFNGDIAELIVYNRKLDNCEIEKVNVYLSTKYHIDFNNAGYHYNLPTPHINDINGIGKLNSACNVFINSASSSILTVSNPSSNDTIDEFLTFGNATSSSATIPQQYIARLPKEWRFDVDGSLGSVDLCFDLSAQSVQNYNAGNFALLIDNDGNFSNAQVINTGKTLSGTTLCFSGVNIPQGNYITLATAINQAPVISSLPAAQVAENTTPVINVTASDAEGENLTYTIPAGNDQSLFEIDASTGMLRFRQAPDFENPADQDRNNIYEVTVAVSDGINTPTTQNLVITVTNVNEFAPVFTSSATAGMAENTGLVTTVTATDQDPGDILSFSIPAGNDRALFTIDASAGLLRFIQAPDFENPADQNRDNVYEITVAVSDGIHTPVTQNLLVTVSNVNEFAPVFTSAAIMQIPENTTSITVLTATDQDTGNSLTYSITGGSDQSLFEINAATRSLRFRQAPDFESPADLDRNNIYELQIAVSDGINTPAIQDLTISVTDVNEFAPVFTSPYLIQIPENRINVITATATDQDLADQLLFSIAGGNDNALFRIDGNTGALRFDRGADFENPADHNHDNIYELTVAVSDGQHQTLQNLLITITDTDELAPVFTNPASIEVIENTLPVTTILATDTDSPNGVTYSFSGGLDYYRFEINPTTGVLRFKQAPDFENPGDQDRNNIYEVTVTATDGLNPSVLEMFVTVTNANEFTPVITTPAVIQIPETVTDVLTVGAIDQDLNDVLTFSISGGYDKSFFEIDTATGALKFKELRDFDSPADHNQDNVYEVIVKVSDGANSTEQNILVTVTGAGGTPNVPVVDAGFLYIPNAVSPGSSDPEQQIFKPKGVRLKTYSIKVYNKWGEQVWQSDKLDDQGSPSEGWDGTVKGQPGASGLYLWSVSATLIDDAKWKGMAYEGDKRKTTGPVYLIR